MSIEHEFDKVKSNGLPDNDYNRSLFQFDMDVLDALSESGNGFAFLVETFSGKRTYYGCFRDQAEVESHIEAVRKAYPRHKIEMGFRPNAAWKFYADYRKQFPW